LQECDEEKADIICTNLSMSDGRTPSQRRDGTDKLFTS